MPMFFLSIMIQISTIQGVVVIIRGLSKLLIAVSTFMIASFFIFYASAQTAMTKNYDPATKTITINLGTNRLLEFQLISNTEQCLVDCEAVIRIRPQINIQTPPFANNDFKWDFIKANSNHLGLQSHSFEILETMQYTINNYKEVCNNYNATETNGTLKLVENCTLVIENSYTITRQEYRPFNFWAATFETGKDHYIKLKGKKHATLGENNVEWVPTFYGLQLSEFAWWNSNWSYTRSLSIKNMNNSVILTEYHPIRVVVDTASLISAGKMRSNCLDARFLYNNITEMDYNVTNCNSATTVFDFQLRGKNITGNANDTSFNFYYGNLVNNSYIPKNRTEINGTKVLPSTRVLLHFNEMAGSTVYDASPYGQNASVDSGTVWNSSGVFDGSKSYTVATDRMSIPDGANAEIEYNTDWTLEFWLWSNDRANSHFVSKTDATAQKLEIARSGSQDINIMIRDSSNNVVSITTTENPLDSRWHHIALISNTSADRYFVFLDGRQIANQTNTHTASIQSSTPWRFGSMDRDPNLAPLDTTIDGFRLSNDTLTTAQMHVLRPEPLTALGQEEPRPISANETDGDQAIVNGITNALGSNATVYSDQKLYMRNTTGGQLQGTFDRVAVQGNQTWAFNYVTEGESLTNISSLFRTVNVWENQSINSSQITSQVEIFINQTKV